MCYTSIYNFGWAKSRFSFGLLFKSGLLVGIVINCLGIAYTQLGLISIITNSNGHKP